MKWKEGRHKVAKAEKRVAEAKIKLEKAREIKIERNVEMKKELAELNAAGVLPHSLSRVTDINNVMRRAKGGQPTCATA